KQHIRDWVTRKVRHSAPDKARTMIKRSLNSVSEAMLLVDRIKSDGGVEAGLRHLRQKFRR
ncbi:MAG: hypothetical protein IJC63_05575, partial [Myxococcaceae bacterium]|nr:hypothetical protein [Myxococcaceae bacterium]